MKKGFSRALVTAGTLGVGTIGLTAVTGCEGLPWGQKRQQVTHPVSDDRAYASSRQADPHRTGDLRRVGPIASGSLAGGGPRPIGGNASGNGSTALPEYVVLGSVVANVNGTPIYGHELLRHAQPLLRARAKELDEAAFRQMAQKELWQQRRALIRSELVYAAALRGTTADEQNEASLRTFAIREQLVSRAGGSVQMARAIERERGEDFDAMLKREERSQLIGIYYRKRIYPRVNPSAEEMRRYYEQNVKSQFTVLPQATIGIIRIDIKDAGSESAALDGINEAHRRAEAGEDFGALSDAYNKLPVLVQSRGQVGPLSPGSYAIDEVDRAIWDLDVGKVTPVISTPQAFFIVKVFEKKAGRVMAFDEQEVQAAITQALRELKITTIEKQQNEQAEKDAVVQDDDALLQPVLEMAMQLYPEWKAATR